MIGHLSEILAARHLSGEELTCLAAKISLKSPIVRPYFDGLQKLDVSATRVPGKCFNPRSAALLNFFFLLVRNTLNFIFLKLLAKSAGRFF